MSDSFFEELDSLVGKHKQAEVEQKRDEATEERFSRIESGFDKLGKLIEERLPANSPPQSNSEDSAENKGGDEPIASGDSPSAPADEPDLEVERITKFSVPKIYTGDDEPEIVKYIDAETGEEKTRKGRRKNRPTGYDVENVVAETSVETEGIPTEPDEQTA